MKWTLTFLLFPLLFSLSSCNGKSEEEILAEDTAIIVDYLTENNLLDDALVTSTGMYYIIHNAGDPDDRPSLNDEVKCNYKGYYPDGQVFDESDGAIFTLGLTIKGWKQGIPLIGVGGTIQLFVPSHLAYGKTGRGSIPPNQVLFFDVDLLKVN